MLFCIPSWYCLLVGSTQGPRRRALGCARRLRFIAACFMVHPRVGQAVSELWAILKDSFGAAGAALAVSCFACGSIDVEAKLSDHHGQYVQEKWTSV